MKIATDHYQLEFPKYAKKVKTKILPLSAKDRNQIITLLEQARIKYILEEDEKLGIYGKYRELVQKLEDLLNNNTNHYQGKDIAARLKKDMQFRAVLG